MDFFTWLTFIFVHCIHFLTTKSVAGFALIDIFGGTLFLYYVTKIVKGVHDRV